MRFIYLLLLLIFLAAIGLFAFRNQQNTPIAFGIPNTAYNWQVDQPLSLLSAEIYVLGMLSGWSVVGMLRRSIERVTDRRE